METCPTGKSCFATWSQANHRAKAMNRYRPQDGEYFMAYRCTGTHGCGHYHVGGRNAKEHKARQRNRRQ